MEQSYGFCSWFFSGTLINGIDRSSLSTANTFIGNDLHLNLTTMGWVLSSFGWAYLLFNLPAGWLCDRFGTKKVYGIAALIWSIASAMTGLAKGLSMLIFSRVFVGVGEAANFPAATKVIAENFDESERGTATGIYLAGLRLGFALTPGLMLGLMIAIGSQSGSTAILWSIPQDLAPNGTAGSLGGIMNTAGALASIVSPALTGYIAQYYGFAAALIAGGTMMLAAALLVLFFLTRISPLQNRFYKPNNSIWTSRPEFGRSFKIQSHKNPPLRGISALVIKLRVFICFDPIRFL